MNMGQIWNRLRRVILSNTPSERQYSVEDYELAEDDDLKKKIDDATQRQSGSYNGNEFLEQSRYRSKKAEIENSYKVLGVNEAASVDQIKTAYRMKIREVHPDIVASRSKSDQEQARKKAIEINEAYRILKILRNF